MARIILNMNKGLKITIKLFHDPQKKLQIKLGNVLFNNFGIKRLSYLKET